MTNNLEIGRVYKVRHRTWDNKRIVTAKRRYIGEEKRFGEIRCFVFSSRITRQPNITELSIPHYDLKEVREL